MKILAHMSKNHPLNEVHSPLVMEPLTHLGIYTLANDLGNSLTIDHGAPSSHFTIRGFRTIYVSAHNDQLFYLVLVTLAINALSVLWAQITQQTAPCGSPNLLAILHVYLLYRYSWALHNAMYNCISFWLSPL